MSVLHSCLAAGGAPRPRARLRQDLPGHHADASASPRPRVSCGQDLQGNPRAPVSALDSQGPYRIRPPQPQPWVPRGLTESGRLSLHCIASVIGSQQRVATRWRLQTRVFYDSRLLKIPTTWAPLRGGTYSSVGRRIGSRMQEVWGSNPRLDGSRVSPFQVSGGISTLQSRASGLQSTTQGIPSGPKMTPPSQKQQRKPCAPLRAHLCCSPIHRRPVAKRAVGKSISGDMPKHAVKLRDG